MGGDPFKPGVTMDFWSGRPRVGFGGVLAFWGEEPADSLEVAGGHVSMSISDVGDLLLASSSSRSNIFFVGTLSFLDSVPFFTCRLCFFVLAVLATAGATGVEF